MSEHATVAAVDDVARLLFVGPTDVREQGIEALDAADEEFTAFEAEEIETALELLSDHQQEALVTTDILPDGTGIELCKQAATIAPETGTVLLVEERTEAVAAAAIEAGVDGYVHAAIEENPAEFRAAVQDAVQRGANSQTEFLRRFRSLQEATQTLAAAESITAICEIAVTVARDSLNLPLSGIHLRDESGLEPVAITEEVEATFGTPPTYTPDDTFVWEAYEHQESKRFERADLIDDPQASDSPVESGMVLSLGEHGVHLLTSTEPHAFSETDRFFATLLASTTESALDRVAATEQLRTQRNRFAQLFEAVSDPVIEYRFEDDGAVIETVNDPFEQVFGYDEETVRGAYVDELLVPVEAKTAAQQITARAEDGEAIQQEVVRKTADGTRPFLLRNAPWDDGEGGYALYIDISDRKEREQTVASLHAATRSLVRADSQAEISDITVETARDVVGLPYSAVFLYDEASNELRATGVTKESVETFGTPPVFEPGEGIVGHVFETGERVVLDDAHESGRGLDDGPEKIRTYSALPLGSHGVMTIAAPTPAAFDENTVEIAEVLASNTTTAFDRLEREAALRKREEQLRQQNERLEAFASVVSHDLRNPLTLLSGSLELAEATGDPEHFEDAHAAIDRMEGMIDDLLVLARQGDTVDDRQPTSVAGVVEAAWDEVPTADASLEITDERIASVDPDRLRQLFANLFRNAVEHGGDDVIVEFGTFEDGVYVADDGPGIPEEERDQVFDHGFTTSSDGTGLGLKIVADIADAHGWELAVAESEAGGARIELHGVKDQSFDGNDHGA